MPNLIMLTLPPFQQVKHHDIKVINDDSEELDCKFLNNRQDFSNICRGNHYQFDELCRAKHSSMMVPRLGFKMNRRVNFIAKLINYNYNVKIVTIY